MPVTRCAAWTRSSRIMHRTSWYSHPLFSGDAWPSRLDLASNTAARQTTPTFTQSAKDMLKDLALLPSTVEYPDARTLAVALAPKTGCPTKPARYDRVPVAQDRRLCKYRSGHLDLGQRLKRRHAMKHLMSGIAKTTQKAAQQHCLCTHTVAMNR